MSDGTDFNKTIVEAAAETLRDLSPGLLRRIDTHALARDLTALSYGCPADGFLDALTLVGARLIAVSHGIKAWCAGVKRP